VTPTVHGEVAWDFGGPIRFWGDDRHRTPVIQFDTNPIDVERLVGKQGAEDDAFDQRGDADAVVALSWQQDEAGQIAQRIDHCDNFGRQAAA
jgi:hypothetical protein